MVETFLNVKSQGGPAVEEEGETSQINESLGTKRVPENKLRHRDTASWFIAALKPQQ